jgi:CheY-like chemotaxis protein
MSTATDILVVEDNPDDLALTLRALRKVGLDSRIEVLRDGAELLAYLYGEGGGAAVRPARQPHLILMDLKMPKYDGLELLERLKGDARTKSIPVVVLTSSAERSDIRRAYLLGANSYVVKPVEFEQFARTVQQVGLYWLGFNQTPHFGGTA